MYSPSHAHSPALPLTRQFSIPLFSWRLLPRVQQVLNPLSSRKLSTCSQESGVSGCTYHNTTRACTQTCMYPNPKYADESRCTVQVLHGQHSHRAQRILKLDMSGGQYNSVDGTSRRLNWFDTQPPTGTEGRRGILGGGGANQGELSEIVGGTFSRPTLFNPDTYQELLHCNHSKAHDFKK